MLRVDANVSVALTLMFVCLVDAVIAHSRSFPSRSHITRLNHNHTIHSRNPIIIQTQPTIIVFNTSEAGIHKLDYMLGTMGDSIVVPGDNL